MYDLDRNRSRRVGLVWFTNNLRVHDNPCLVMASREVDALHCVYFNEPDLQQPGRYGIARMGAHRQDFLNDSLEDLASSLETFNQCLHVYEHGAIVSLPSLIIKYRVTDLYVSRQTDPQFNSPLFPPHINNIYFSTSFFDFRNSLLSSCSSNILHSADSASHAHFSRIPLYSVSALCS